MNTEAIPELPGNSEPVQLRLWDQAYHDSLLDLSWLWERITFDESQD